MLEGVAVGDCHLDKLHRHFGDAAIDLQIAEIEKPLQYAEKMGLKNAFFLGDISDDERLSDEGKIALINLFHRWDNRLNIYVILGNHDFRLNGYHSLQVIEELQKFNIFKTIKFISKPKQVKMKGVTVNFLPFPATRPSKDMVRKHQVVNVAHLERPGALRDNGTKITKGGVPSKDKDHWLIGHLHTKQELGLNYFPGTVYQLNFGESLPKGFVHFSYKQVGTKVKAKYKWIQTNPAFKFFNVDVEKASDLKEISDNPLYKYKLFVSKGVKLPNNFLVDKPNIVSVAGYSSKEELKTIKQAEAIPDFNMRGQLKSWLRTTKKFSKAQVRRSLKLDKERLKRA